MTNIFNHHLARSVFSEPAHAAFEYPSSTEKRPEAGKRAESLHSAPPRSLPLDAACGIPREPARQVALGTPQRPEAFSTQESLPAKGNIEPLRIRRGVPPHESQISDSSEPRIGIERPLRGVRQDKARLESARIASPQPAPVTKVTRALFTNNSVARTHSVPGARERRQRVTLWVDPRVKTHLARLAEQEGLTVSAAGSALLTRALQQNIDLQYGALLTPIIKQAIARQMRGIATRLAWLLVRIAFDSGQTRSLVTNILGRQPGMNQDLLRTILAESGKTAKANITRRTPQITQLIESVEQWIKKNDGGDKKS